MIVYYFFFSILCLGAIISHINTKSGNRVYLFLMCMSIWLLIGLRHIGVGVDTESYVNDFHFFSTLSLTDSLKYNIDKGEPLYIIITWFCSRLTNSYTFFLLIWASFPAIALYLILKSNLKNSIEYFEALLVICILGLYAFFVAGIRQTASISIILISYQYLKESKPFKFFACKIGRAHV